MPYVIDTNKFYPIKKNVKKINYLLCYLLVESKERKI